MHALKGGAVGTVTPLRGKAVLTRAGVAPLVAGLAARHGPGLPDRRAARRRRRDPDVPLVRRRAEAHQAPRGVRPRRHRGRRRPRGRQQRRRRRRAGPAADHRAADLGDGGGDPDRVPVLRPAAGAAAVQRVRAAGLRAAGQPLHRQRDAAGPQPAAGEGVGPAAGDPGVRDLRRDHGVRDARHLRLRRRPGRPAPALRARHARRADGHGRHPGRAGHRRADPRSALRGADAARGAAVGRQRERALRRRAVDHAVVHRAARAGRPDRGVGRPAPAPGHARRAPRSPRHGVEPPSPAGTSGPWLGGSPPGGSWQRWPAHRWTARCTWRVGARWPVTVPVPVGGDPPRASRRVGAGSAAEREHQRADLGGARGPHRPGGQGRPTSR